MAVAKAAFPAWRAANLSRRAEVMFRHARAGRRQPQGDRLAAHRRARQGAVRCDGRGGPRPREHRVRLRRAAPDEGRLQRAGGDRRRRVLDPPAARRRGRHHPVQLPGDGADVDVRQRPRLRQHVRPQAVARRIRRRRCSSPSCWRRPACRPGASTSCRATRSPSTGSSSIPTSPPSASSARHRSPSTSTRPAPATASACRRSAAPRTTCWCWPTPTSTWPPTPPIGAAYGSAGERCMAISVVLAAESIADELVAKIAERIPGVKVGPGNEPDSRDGPADHRRAPRQGRRLHRRRRRPRAPRWSSTAARSATTAGSSSTRR